MKKTNKILTTESTNGEPEVSNNEGSDISETTEKKTVKSEYLTEDVDDEGALNKLFLDLLKDVYWAEKYLVKKLPVAEEAATTSLLKKALHEHWLQTKKQVEKVEQVFESIGEDAVSKKCVAMHGLVEEVEEIIHETDDQTLTRDVGIIIAAQKVEHYEIAAYGGLAALAQVLGHKEATKILLEILEEEKGADSKLSEIAQGKRINAEAAAE
ncbi:MAG: DUF892 family protein [Chitinophagales bacterium]|jgi:ferritin-like metal-binding protein YciE|nr:DUF892 family protein [Bacteroidota bacterium]MBP8916280.1 DUF892 family protein [Chitinophagales bacterium]MBP9221855.1 DUF892 family protein [Chitinophagales bacterium]